MDGFYVSRAVDTLYRSILPHTYQTLGQFETQSADQRTRLTADAVLAPYDLLFDYSSLESAYPIDPAFRPVLLFGEASGLVGRGPSLVPRQWRERVAGDALHVVVEASDAGSGLR